jgi:hypothetical protein
MLGKHGSGALYSDVKGWVRGPRTVRGHGRIAISQTVPSRPRHASEGNDEPAANQADRRAARQKPDNQRGNESRRMAHRLTVLLLESFEAFSGQPEAGDVLALPQTPERFRLVP